jgi:hypothetical protein
MNRPTEQSFAEIQRLIADPTFRAVRVPEATVYRNHTIVPEGIAAPATAEDEHYAGIVVMDEFLHVVSDGFLSIEHAKEFIDRWLDEGWSKVGGAQ